MVELPASGEQWAREQWSLDYFPVGCGVAGCKTCDKGTNEDHRRRRALLIRQVLDFIEETGDGLLPYVLREACQTHTEVVTYLDHIVDIDRLQTAEERKAVSQHRTAFYTLLLEDLRAVLPLSRHSPLPVSEKSEVSMPQGVRS